MLRTVQLLPQRAFDTGLRPGPFPTRAASLLPGLLTATRTGLTPASDDEREQQITPSRGHLPFHWAHQRFSPPEGALQPHMARDFDQTRRRPARIACHGGWGALVR